MTCATLPISREVWAAFYLATTQAHVRECPTGDACPIASQLAENLEYHLDNVSGFDLDAAALMWLDHGLDHVAACPSNECHFNGLFWRAADKAGVGKGDFERELGRVQRENGVRAVARYLASRGK